MANASSSNSSSLVEAAEKALAERQYENAVELFTNACEKYNMESGGKDDPELLYKYGNALFQLARSQVGVLDQKQADERQLPVEHSHVQLAEDSAAPEAGAENAGSGDKPSTTESSEKREGDAPAEAQKKQDNGDEEDQEDQVGEDADEDADEDEGEDEGEGEGEEEEETDFKTAFKVVDWARVLWSKEDQTPEIRQKLLDARNLLGEISDEDDNHLQATEDFEAALELTEELNAADSMPVCEAHWKLARAYANAEEIKQAAEHAQKAAEIARHNKSDLAADLETRAEDLKKEAESGSASSAVAKETAQDVAGRQASIARDVFSNLLSGAQDISSFTRKRKRTDNNPSSKKSSKPN